MRCKEDLKQRIRSMNQRRDQEEYSQREQPLKKQLSQAQRQEQTLSNMDSSINNIERSINKATKKQTQ